MREKNYRCDKCGTDDSDMLYRLVPVVTGFSYRGDGIREKPHEIVELCADCLADELNAVLCSKDVPYRHGWHQRVIGR